ncbi:hypothetical protein HYS91_05250 [Candidatus Daviesbacteria bacterium]|nr:hypothetical protein [Candidatus Daviesbacteria bacterium]
MKFKLALLTAATILYLTPLYPVYAKDSTPSGDKIRAIDRLIEQKENLKEKLNTKIENIASREAKLLAKLKTFKDQVKAKRVENINRNLNMINQKLTKAYTRHLTTMENLLKRFEAKPRIAPLLTSNFEVKQSFDSAETLIADARVAVASQAAEEYTITVSSESAVNKDALDAKNTLRADLKEVREKITAARRAIIDAIRLGLKIAAEK